MVLIPEGADVKHAILTPDGAEFDEPSGHTADILTVVMACAQLAATLPDPAFFVY